MDRPGSAVVSGGRFELSGGAPCLDFANTLADRPFCSKESLAGYDDLLEWALEAGILDRAQHLRLRRHAAKQPGRARKVFERALRLRESIFRVFSAIAGGRPPVPGDLATLNTALAEALPHLRLEPGGPGRFRWAWGGPPARLDRMLWPVVRSAAELLASGEIPLVRECASDRCSWLFVDRSRSRRRRWCDMKTCGNRAKARRHWERHKKGC